VKLLTGVAVALSLLLLPSAAVAQTELPVGEAHGVKVGRDARGAIVVVLSPKLHKRFAGKELIVSCTRLDDDGSLTGPEVVEVPERSRRLVTGDRNRKLDYCRVWRPRTKHAAKRILVSVPLTQKGAVFLDEERKTRTMFGVLSLADVAAEKLKLDGSPTYDQLITAVPRRAQAELSKFVVALPAPTAAPPPHKVGYYGDGTEQVAVAIVSAAGRVLFWRFGPDDVVSTNVLGYLLNEPD
jgi:hypothetical protein